MRTLREIYQANRAETISLHESVAQVQLELYRAKQEASQREAEGQQRIVKNFLIRKLGDRILTNEVNERLEQLSSEQLDDLLFQAASWNNPTQIQDYFNIDSLGG
jgi:hypothetical protein